MNIWKTYGNMFWRGLFETEVVVKKRVEQVQCPHDLGGCGRFMDKSSVTYIDPQTKKRVRDPERISHIVGAGILIAGILTLILLPLRSAAFQLLVDYWRIFIIRHVPNNFTWFDWIVLLYMCCFLCMSSLIEHFIQKNGKEIRSQADRIETYHCPNPACGLRSTFINGKPVKLK